MSDNDIFGVRLSRKSVARSIPRASYTPPPVENPTKKFWLCLSQSPREQWFTMDLAGSPVVSEKRAWRLQQGRWDFSNAVCQNTTSCFIGKHQWTVAEWCAQARALARPEAVPSVENPKCSKCGSDLMKAPGAQYIGGDGMETWSYLGDFEPDPFITEFRMSDNDLAGSIKTAGWRHGFSVDIRRSTEDTWTCLLTVSYDKEADLFKWREIQPVDGKLRWVSASGKEHPEIFRGFDEERLGEDAQGTLVKTSHFPFRRARYARFRSLPEPQKLWMFSNPEGRGVIQEAGPSIAIPQGVGVLEGVEEAWIGGYVEIMDGSRVESFYTVEHSDKDRIYLSGKLDDAMVGKSYRVWRLAYVSTCGRFEPYGARTRKKEVTETPPPVIENIGMTFGNTMYHLRSAPSLIMAVECGMDDVAMFDLQEVSADEAEDASFTWVAEERTLVIGKETLKYDAVVSGKYFYDYDTRCVVIPSAVTGGSETASSVFELNKTWSADYMPGKWMPSFLRVKYITGPGTSVTIPAVAVKPGLRYASEKSSVLTILGSENVKDYDIGDYSLQTRKMGKYADSVNMRGRTAELKWSVRNDKPMTGGFSAQFIGNELPAQGWREGVVKAMASKRITGTVSGEVTITGKPGVILTGTILVAADGGGLKDDGLWLLADLESNKGGRQGACFNVPTLLVYLKEKEQGNGGS